MIVMFWEILEQIYSDQCNLPGSFPLNTTDYGSVFEHYSFAWPDHEHPFKLDKSMRQITLLTLALVVLAYQAGCIGYSSSIDRDIDRANQCVEITISKCENSYAHALIINNCSQSIWQAEILLSGYNEQNSSEIELDKELIKDFLAGDNREIDLIFGAKPKNSLDYCEAKIVNVVFVPFKYVPQP